jgi:hypothetical protein
VLLGDDRGPVFLEGAGVGELGDVLARHAVAKGVALADGVGAVFVQREGVAVEDFA